MSTPRTNFVRRCSRSGGVKAAAWRAACAVTKLANDIGMEFSAVSHQLRQLRHLGLVVGERRGKQVIYGLHDDHVAELLDQAIFHVQHLRLDARQPLRDTGTEYSSTP